MLSSSRAFFSGGSSATQTLTARGRAGEDTTVVGATGIIGATGATGATRATLGPAQTVEGSAESTVRGRRLTVVAAGRVNDVGG